MSKYTDSVSAHLLRIAEKLGTDQELRDELRVLKRTRLGDVNTAPPQNLERVLAKIMAITGAGSLLSGKTKDKKIEPALKAAGDVFADIVGYLVTAEAARSLLNRLRAHAAICYELAGFTANARVMAKSLSIPAIEPFSEVTVGDLQGEPECLMQLLLQQDLETVAVRCDTFLSRKEELRHTVSTEDEIESALFFARLSVVAAISSFTKLMLKNDREKYSEAMAFLDQAAELFNAVEDYEHGFLATQARSLMEVMWSKSVWKVVAPHLSGEKYTDYLYHLAKSVPTIWESQRQILERGLLSNTVKRLLMSLPTSSGKSLLAEMCVAKSLLDDPVATCLYITPSVALASQVEKDLNERIGQNGLGIPVASVTGSYDITKLDEIRAMNCRVLVATPEKLDSLTRRRGDRLLPTFNQPALIVVDECHMLGQPKRGLLLELLMIRLRKKFPEAKVLGLSAVMSNSEEIARWLNADVELRARGPEDLVSSWRPTRLLGAALSEDGILHYLEQDEFGTVQDAFPVKTSIRGKLTMREKAAKLAIRYARIRTIRSVLVFSNTVRRSRELALEIEQTADLDEEFPFDLTTSPWARRRLERQLQRLEAFLEATTDAIYFPELPRLASKGIAFHHAQLSRETREMIERAFRAGTLRVLVATATLAEGVNLPVGCVILPYLHLYQGTRLEPMPASMFRNIAGRAGRASHHVEGHVIVIDPEKGNKSTFVHQLMVASTRRYLSLQPSDMPPVNSQVPSIALSTHEISDGVTDPNLLVYQSGILGMLCEDNMTTKEIGRLADLSLLNEQGDRRRREGQVSFEDVKTGLAGLNEALFDYLTQPIEGHDIQPFTRNSPLRPSELGYSMAQTGLSIASCRRLFKGCITWIRDAGLAGLQMRLDDFELGTVLDTVFGIAEFTTHDQYDPELPHKDLVLRWIKGDSLDCLTDVFYQPKLRHAEEAEQSRLNRLAKQGKKGIKRQVDEEKWRREAGLECADYFRRFITTHLPWLTNGYFLLFDYEWRRRYGEKARYNVDLEYLSLYVKHGVNEPSAAQLAELGIRDRHAALWLASQYDSENGEDGWQELSEWLEGLDLDRLRLPNGISKRQLQIDLAKARKSRFNLQD